MEQQENIAVLLGAGVVGFVMGASIVLLFVADMWRAWKVRLMNRLAERDEGDGCIWLP